MPRTRSASLQGTSLAWHGRQVQVSLARSVPCDTWLSRPTQLRVILLKLHWSFLRWRRHIKCPTISHGLRTARPQCPLLVSASQQAKHRNGPLLTSANPPLQVSLRPTPNYSMLNSFSPISSTVWNSLPATIQSIHHSTLLML